MVVLKPSEIAPVSAMMPAEVIHAAGLLSFCVSIDPAGHDYLRQMCLARDYLVLSDIAAEASELSKIYRALSA